MSDLAAIAEEAKKQDDHKSHQDEYEDSLDLDLESLEKSYEESMSKSSMSAALSV